MTTRSVVTEPFAPTPQPPPRPAPARPSQAPARPSQTLLMPPPKTPPRSRARSQARSPGQSEGIMVAPPKTPPVKARTPLRQDRAAIREIRTPKSISPTMPLVEDRPVGTRAPTPAQIETLRPHDARRLKPETETSAPSGLHQGNEPVGMGRPVRKRKKKRCITDTQAIITLQCNGKR